MSEMGDDFRAMRDHRRKVNDQNRNRRVPQIQELDYEGFEVEEITSYQFRINDRLDLYPTNALWHDIELKKRGSFHGQNVKEFVREYFAKLTDEHLEGSKKA